MLKDFSPRLYQETIFSTCAKKNTLVVLPTGLGKTLIALMLTVQRLKQYPQSKILFLAPTRPLVEQHLSTFKEHLEMDEERFAVFTGHVSPEKRAELWKKAQIFFSTPQGMENDIINEKIKLEEVSLIIFDEAHRSVGDYAYNFIAKQYNKKALRPRILALTASPGSEAEKIQEVCQNLFIEDVELRAEEDIDVREYVQEMRIDWIKVELTPELKKVRNYLLACFKSKLIEVKSYGYLNSAHAETSKTDLLKLQGLLHLDISKGDKSLEVMRSISLIAEAMKVQHALELLETQGINPLNEYIHKLEQEAVTTKVKAVQNLVKDPNFKVAVLMVSRLYEANIEHPKLGELKRIVAQEVARNPEIKIIIFNQYRDTAMKIIEELGKIDSVTSKLFVGQAKKKSTGISQKQQKEIIEAFKQNGFNCLVATSVAEEGLDIPSVDLVIFYEPIPSGIRTIQRRGRTGRQDKGRVLILMTKDTRDEGYKWSAHHKERKMKKTMLDLKRKFAFSLKNVSQRELTTKLAMTTSTSPATPPLTPSLERYIPPEPDTKIFVDYREKGSGITKELIDLGIKIEMKQLEVGDYLLSSRCGIEYKRVPDFVDSIVDGRLLSQVKSLKENFERPIIIIEGEENIYSQRNIHPNAIRGMMGTIAVAYGIPVIQTKDFKETAAFLAIIAKREQDETSTNFSAHGSRKPLSLKEQQEYIVSALPNVGPGLSKELLKRFGTVLQVMNASTDEFMQIDKMGPKKATEIQRVLTEKYKEF
ncbi:MAG: DEAD/DEAH box helicase [Nanoarchaeota archaeon]|nr:DEAD/DEAH box helicase [Nanoarchaeota archaeon]